MKRISARDRQRLFNERGFWQRVKDGEWVARAFEEWEATGPTAPKSAPSNLPPGSKGQQVHYFDNHYGLPRRRAIVHQYLQPDGTLGASGKPDPKWLMDDDGTIYGGPKKGQSPEPLPDSLFEG